jgi:hypothetical protein
MLCKSLFLLPEGDLGFWKHEIFRKEVCPWHKES